LRFGALLHEGIECDRTRGSLSQEADPKSNNAVTFPLRPCIDGNESLLTNHSGTRNHNTQEDIMKTKNIGFQIMLALTASVLVAPAVHSQTERFSASLSGANEVPPINSAGTADFQMSIEQGTITFSLDFSDLSSPLAVAHLHFAPSKVAGGVMIFLCGGGNQPACPAATSGNITGTITAANVTGPTGQGIAPMDLDSALEAVRNDLSYANMHTANFLTGEIRGQVRRGLGHDRGGE
jgi:CHRD domain